MRRGRGRSQRRHRPSSTRQTFAVGALVPAPTLGVVEMFGSIELRPAQHGREIFDIQELPVEPEGRAHRDRQRPIREHHHIQLVEGLVAQPVDLEAVLDCLYLLNKWN